MFTSLASRSDGAGVELVAWPDDAPLREQLARAGVPRMLLVSETTPPPTSLAFDEDWIRTPFDEGDLKARVDRLAMSVAQLASNEPRIDDERVLHRGHRTVVLTAAEVVVVGALLDVPGEVVTHDHLGARLWPDVIAPSGRAVDAVIYRLRRRIIGLGLSIRASRGLGFLLDHERPPARGSTTSPHRVSADRSDRLKPRCQPSIP